MGNMKGPGRKKAVSGMDITKQLRGVKFMRLFWNRKYQKTRLHESGPEQRNPSYSLEMHPGSRIPGKDF
jgi:hypothetical protein